MTVETAEIPTRDPVAPEIEIRTYANGLKEEVEVVRWNRLRTEFGWMLWADRLDRESPYSGCLLKLVYTRRGCPSDGSQGVGDHAACTEIAATIRDRTKLSDE